MAIDTRNKKLSVISLMQPYNCPIPVSSNGLDRADLFHLIWDYSWRIILQISVLLVTGDCLKSGTSVGSNISTISPKKFTKGVKFRLNFGESLDTATVKQIRFSKPNGEVVTYDGQVYESNYLEYTTVDDELDVEGDWYASIYVEAPYFSGYSGTFVFKVKNIDG